MAIQFARARYISRSTGGSAVRSAAYNERADISTVVVARQRKLPEYVTEFSISHDT